MHADNAAVIYKYVRDGVGRQTTLPVALKCKTHGWPRDTGSYYGSSPSDHATNRAEVQLSSHTASQGQGWGQEHTCHGAQQGHSSRRPATGMQDREGIKGSRSRGKGDALSAAWHKGSGGRAEPELGSSMEGEMGEREDSLLLFPQQ